MGNILIIDDNKINSEALCDIVGSMGHEVTCTPTAKEGLRAAHTHSFDVVFLDIQLPDGNGLTLLPEIRATAAGPEVIIITGYGSPDGAELAVKNGAWDFIEKPIVKKMIELPLVRALQYREAKNKKRAPVVMKREGIIGSSPVMDSCLELCAQAAAGDANVLIAGETGTGKELFAQAVHNNSRWASMPFITVDCASLPPSIIESILFGHEKGAFTGADISREGLIKQAHRGSLFLDEIGDLPLSAQKAFLRVLQEHRFRPVGGKREVESEFRTIAATNRDLDKMVRDGRFREDLLFRLRAFTIELPPLRIRISDIKELIFYYVNKICMRQGAEMKGFSPEFLETLCKYEWPGNVRELVNALESALATALHESILYPKHLPTHIRVHLARNAVQRKESRTARPATTCTLKEHRESVCAKEEKQYLQELINMTEGNIKKSCDISGLQRARLYQLFQKHGIEIPK
jgi:two-component system NtrC family response regulator